ncbi:MAG TPA: glycosyltransferase family 1 protein, partial [Polyangiaceae bacterium]|nr:glycosyltransferase family 1 protein [Polyangiaceae bacterium]
ECSEIYAPTADIQEIADRIDRLLARDPAALSAAAIRAAETLLTMDQHFDALFELYDRLRRSSDPRAAVL